MADERMWLIHPESETGVLLFKVYLVGSHSYDDDRVHRFLELYGYARDNYELWFEADHGNKWKYTLAYDEHGFRKFEKV